jgi:hypothetical protein
MIYNRTDIEEERKEIDRTFVNKTDLTIEDRKKAIFDIYLKREITNKELLHYLESIQPKQLYHKSEFTGYT